jgi:hypothetical protein
VRSASLYKTKACGVMRNSMMPSSRVIIEQSPSNLGSSRTFGGRRKSSTSSQFNAGVARKSIDGQLKSYYIPP